MKMPSRLRQSISTTTPARSPTQASASTTSRSATIELPPYEPPTAPLNADARQELENLLQHTFPTTKLSKHLKTAASELCGASSEINERLTDTEAVVRRKRARRAKEGIDDEEADERESEEVRSMRVKVEGMTSRMETCMRRCIDGHAGIQNVEEILKELSRSAAASAAAANAASVTSTQATSTQRSRAARRMLDSDDDEDVDMRDADVTQPESQQGIQPGPVPSQPSPPQHLVPAFTDELQRRTDRYTSLSLQTRYAKHNDYISFKKQTFDAQHPETSAPPMPHASTWFSAEEGNGAGPAPGVTNASAADEGDDEDIAIARVKIATRCPLTLREFIDPVTSSKCSHSFERAAIFHLIDSKRPPTARPGQRRPQPPPQGWIPSAQCPVAGCDCDITKEDLHHDEALVRKIKRIQRAQELEAEGDASHVGGDGVEEVDSDSGEDIDDVDEATAASSARVKTERLSGRNTAAEDIEDD